MRIAGLAAATVLLSHTPAFAQQPLTLKAAEQMALANHPQIRASELGAAAAGEVVREARSAYFPTVYGSLTGVNAQDGSRIAAGGLNNPIIYDRFAGGVTVNQLLTDFGRTRELVNAASMSADAQERNVDTRKADVLFRVDRAYFNVLRAQAVRRVADATVAARQLVADQVSALAASNLKSSLDVSFARVSLGEAQLLLVQARNDLSASFAELAAALGSATVTEYALEEADVPAAPPQDDALFAAEALRNRPDVAAERANVEAAASVAAAERALVLPSVSAVGTFGSIPYHQIGLNSRYAALGFNVNVPLTNGDLYAARRSEAALRADAERQRLRDLENQVSRDVRIAWLDAQSSFQRLDLTNQMLEQASLALDLAQSRYDLGLSSIVELTQAQLAKTRAEIDQASARYDYQARTAALKYQTGTLK
jgi:outer membrane protein